MKAIFNIWKNFRINLNRFKRLGLEAKKEENLPDWYSQVKLITLL
jgi:hypothetical protein